MLKLLLLLVLGAAVCAGAGGIVVYGSAGGGDRRLLFLERLPLERLEFGERGLEVAGELLLVIFLLGLYRTLVCVVTIRMKCLGEENPP